MFRICIVLKYSWCVDIYVRRKCARINKYGGRSDDRSPSRRFAFPFPVSPCQLRARVLTSSTTRWVGETPPRQIPALTRLTQLGLDEGQSLRAVLGHVTLVGGGVAAVAAVRVRRVAVGLDDARVGRRALEAAGAGGELQRQVSRCCACISELVRVNLRRQPCRFQLHCNASVLAPCLSSSIIGCGSPAPLAFTSRPPRSLNNQPRLTREHGPPW